MIVVAVCSVEKYKSVSAASLSQKTSNPLENLDCMFLHNFLRFCFVFLGGTYWLTKLNLKNDTYTHLASGPVSLRFLPHLFH